MQLLDGKEAYPAGLLTKLLFGKVRCWWPYLTPYSSHCDYFNVLSSNTIDRILLLNKLSLKHSQSDLASLHKGRARSRAR
jgi:hypothetical protein